MEVEILPSVNDQQSDLFDLSVMESDNDIVVKKKNDKFKVEINMGLALPCVFRPGDDFDLSRENRSIVKSSKKDGSLFMLEVSTQSNLGPLGANDNDVLTVLLTMAWEQRHQNADKKEERNGFRVYYTLAEICRRLSLSVNSSSNIARSIEKIKSQNMKLKNFIYNAGTKETGLAKEQTKIILKSGELTLGSSNADFKSYQKTFYIEFDSYIMKNMQDEYVSLIHTKEYLSLKSGPERRLLIFLNSKRKTFGNQVLFNLSELAQVLGIASSPNRRKMVGRYLTSTKDKLENFDFKIKKVSNQDDWHILVNFNSDQGLVDQKYEDSFYRELIEFYTPERIASIDLQEIDVINMRKEFDRQYEKTTKNKTVSFGQDDEISPGELVIDIALFQVLMSGYNLTKSFKALARAILSRLSVGELELPEKYRQFVKRRNEDLKKEEAKKAIAKEIAKKKAREKKEEENLKNSFKLFYSDVLENNKTYLKNLETRAKEKIDTSETELFYEARLKAIMKEIAQEEFLSGKILENKEIGRQATAIEIDR